MFSEGRQVNAYLLHKKFSSRDAHSDSGKNRKKYYLKVLEVTQW